MLSSFRSMAPAESADKTNSSGKADYAAPTQTRYHMLRSIRGPVCYCFASLRLATVCHLRQARNKIDAATYVGDDFDRPSYSHGARVSLPKRSTASRPLRRTLLRVWGRKSERGTSRFVIGSLCHRDKQGRL